MSKKQKLSNTDFLDKAFNKLFQSVGFESWDKEFSKRQDWYLQKTWTKEQSDEFKKWFTMEIKKDLNLKKHQAEKEWAYFDLMWGWKEANS
jgi:hypothetical protein